ncbi:MAG: hypothetical protein K8S23_11325 [Candidatus Cloacimonetes bacterium]|nr:hypothetical protein [Candidatus Cloacimonadota bacterium]
MKLKKSLILLFLVAIVQIYMQAYDDVVIDGITSTTYNILYPTYFDPDNPAGQPTLFDLTIRDINPSHTSPYRISVKTSMTWRGNYLIENELATPEQFLSFTSPIFLHNRDVIADETTTDWYVTAKWDEILDNNTDFKDQVLSLGKFPDGIYIFTFQVCEYNTDTAPGDPISIEYPVTINLRSPNPITLITPGSPIGMGALEISDPNPYFVWFSNLHDYTFSIWELDDLSYSIDQIEQMTPYFTEEGISSNGFPFPASKTLKYNTDYAWQITSEIDTPSLDIQIQKSNIYLFKVVGDESNAFDNSILIKLLESYITDDEEGVKELILSLKAGFKLSDEDFERLLYKFSTYKKIKKVTIN